MTGVNHHGTPTSMKKFVGDAHIDIEKMRQLQRNVPPLTSYDYYHESLEFQQQISK